MISSMEILGPQICFFKPNISLTFGSGCGSVCRAVASDTRDPRFESRQRQNFIYQFYNRKDESKEKEAGNGPSNKTISLASKSYFHFYLNGLTLHKQYEIDKISVFPNHLIPKERKRSWH